MPAKQRRYSLDEMQRRGEEIFETRIRDRVKKARKCDFLAIDVETGAYEVDADEVAAADRLEARVPGAQIWMRRIGSPYARTFGGVRSCMIGGTVNAGHTAGG